MYIHIIYINSYTKLFNFFVFVGHNWITVLLFLFNRNSTICVSKNLRFSISKEEKIKKKLK